MAINEIVRYVKDSLARGLSLDEIKKNLRDNGWSNAEINDAINSVSGSSNHSGVSGFKDGPSKRTWLILGVCLIAAVIIVAVFVLVFSGGEETQITCSSLNGYTCSSGETCNGNWLEANDALNCCSLVCTPVVSCTENWACTNWSTCLNNSQNRTCTDGTHCNTTYLKPLETQVCGSQNISNCSAGNNCSFSCINSGGDSDCSCTGFEDYNSQNVSLCGANYVCNGTELNSSSSGVCCLGGVRNTICILPDCSRDGYCKLDCDTGDYDCTCKAQGGSLKTGISPELACGDLIPIFSSQNVAEELYCCKMKAEVIFQ